MAYFHPAEIPKKVCGYVGVAIKKIIDVKSKISTEVFQVVL